MKVKIDCGEAQIQKMDQAHGTRSSDMDDVHIIIPGIEKKQRIIESKYISFIKPLKSKVYNIHDIPTFRRNKCQTVTPSSTVSSPVSRNL